VFRGDYIGFECVSRGLEVTADIKGTLVVSESV